MECQHWKILWIICVIISLEWIYNEPLTLLSILLANCSLMNGWAGRRTSQEEKSWWPTLQGLFKILQDLSHSLKLLWSSLCWSPLLHREPCLGVSRVMSQVRSPPPRISVDYPTRNNKYMIVIFSYIFWYPQLTVKNGNAFIQKRKPLDWHPECNAGDGSGAIQTSG